MRFKARPQDFVVEEQARLPLTPDGHLTVYRVEKRNVTTLQVQIHIAAQLKLRNADVQAPALKDKKALAVQYLSIRGTGPTELDGPGYRARIVGRCSRPLRPSDLTGNRFTVTLRDLSRENANRVSGWLREVARYGLPNYFDEQRFGSYSLPEDAPDRFIGKTILRRDAEGAVRAYLARPFVRDPSLVRAFKTVAAQHWGEWNFLLSEAPRPSNYRSVLTYLQDHPQGFRKALNLIPRRLLSLYLVAYQSYLWNRIAGGYLACMLSAAGPLPFLTILDLTLPVYYELPVAQHTALNQVSIPLPGHRTIYAEPKLAGIVQSVLDEEGLELNDLKARILVRAYLPKGKRALLVHPAEVSCGEIQDDEQFPGRSAIRIGFTLRSGSFATLVLKRLRLADDHQSS